MKALRTLLFRSTLLRHLKQQQESNATSTYQHVDVPTRNVVVLTDRSRALRIAVAIRCHPVQQAWRRMLAFVVAAVRQPSLGVRVASRPTEAGARKMVTNIHHH